MEGEQAGGKRSAWMSHVKKTMKANKGKPLSAVLKMAKKTYKKSMKGGNAPVEEVPKDETSAPVAAPATGGKRKTRKTKKSRKGGRKH
jgi:hypothetical protein